MCLVDSFDPILNNWRDILGNIQSYRLIAESELAYVRYVISMEYFRAESIRGGHYESYLLKTYSLSSVNEIQITYHVAPLLGRKSCQSPCSW